MSYFLVYAFKGKGYIEKVMSSIEYDSLRKKKFEDIKEPINFSSFFDWDGAILALVIPINVWLLYESKKNYLRILLFVFLAILLIGLYFSYTRAAWLSIILAIGVFVLYYFKIKLKWLTAIIIIPSIFIVYNLTEISYLVQKNDAEHTTENFSERVESMSNISSDASNLERLNRWNCALELFLQRPFFGWGPGTYAFVYAPFQKSKDLTIISTNFGDGGNAHSEYLSPLAEQGFFGFLIISLSFSFWYFIIGEIILGIGLSFVYIPFFKVNSGLKKLDLITLILFSFKICISSFKIAASPNL